VKIALIQGGERAGCRLSESQNACKLTGSHMQVFRSRYANDMKANSKFFDNCTGNKKSPGSTLTYFFATVQVDSNNPLTPFLDPVGYKAQLL
jgi:hypothetical protein